MKRTRLVLTALLLGAALVSPSVALAKTKPSTAIRGVGSTLTIHGAGGSVAIKGRLVVRRRVKVGRKYKTLDVARTGALHLIRIDESTFRTVSVAWIQATKSGFSCAIDKPGDYELVHPSTGTTKGSAIAFTVRADVLKITSFAPVSGTLDASGGVFVKLSAYVDAPPSYVTTDAPLMGIFFGAHVPVDVSSAPSIGSLGGLAQLFSHGYLTFLKHPGPCTYGFTVPAEDIDETLTVGAEFGDLGGLIVPVSEETSFVPSALLK